MLPGAREKGYSGRSIACSLKDLRSLNTRFFGLSSLRRDHFVHSAVLPDGPSRMLILATRLVVGGVFHACSQWSLCGTTAAAAASDLISQWRHHESQLLSVGPLQKTISSHLRLSSSHFASLVSAVWRCHHTPPKRNVLSSIFLPCAGRGNFL